MKNILGIVFGINLTQESMPCLKKKGNITNLGKQEFCLSTST